VIEAEPNPILAISDKAKDGHVSVQLGLGTSRVRREAAKGEGKNPKGHRATKAAIGHAKKAGLTTVPRILRSVRLDEPGNAKVEIPELKVGESVNVGVFAVGDTVKVLGTSKGRGFQGVVKRYGIGGGPNTHGNTKHRRPGSIGPGTNPSRVIKGKKMPGHYGDHRHTQTHLRVEKIDAERNLIYIRGSVAGKPGGIVVVKKQG
jgi:large subunit ribosomal protein L3